MDDPDCAQVAQEIELPCLTDRQALTAEDPLSTVLHFDVVMHVVIPALFGTRMCFQCPHWNVNKGDPCLPST